MKNVGLNLRPQLFFFLTQTLTRHTYLNAKPYALIISFFSAFYA